MIHTEIEAERIKLNTHGDRLRAEVSLLRMLIM